MSKKPYRVRLNEALTGDLPVPGGKSMFRILLDEETVGAKNFALLVIEFDPGPEVRQVRCVDLTGQQLRLAPDLFSQFAQKPLLVKSVAGPGQLEGPVRERHRRGNGDGALNRPVYRPRVFSQIFENQISAQTEPHQGQLPIALIDNVVQHDLQIIGGAAVVTAQHPVGFTAAAPEIVGGDVPSCFTQGPGHSQHVGTL